MGDRSKIQWTDATWNPIRGCTRVSEGCRRCYAERVAARFSKPGQPYHGLARWVSHASGLEYEDRAAAGDAEPRWTGEVRLVLDHIDDPLRWTKPRRIFVNSMSDLFHPGVEFSWLDEIFAVMALAQQHTFQILTKRPERAHQYFLSVIADHFERWLKEQVHKLRAMPGRGAARSADRINLRWPLRNVWLGTSAENQPTANERIAALRRVPAAVRFVSYEPALELVDFDEAGAFLIDAEAAGVADDPLAANLLSRAVNEGRGDVRRWIDWLIVGGESGPGARSFDVAWARSAIAQCRKAGVPVFVKQLGSEWARLMAPRAPARRFHAKGGEPTEWPEDLRVREMPR